jgi:hypothetical protein
VYLVLLNDRTSELKESSNSFLSLFGWAAKTEKEKKERKTERERERKRECERQKKREREEERNEGRKKKKEKKKANDIIKTKTLGGRSKTALHGS